MPITKNTITSEIVFTPPDRGDLFAATGVARNGNFAVADKQDVLKQVKIDPGAQTSNTTLTVASGAITADTTITLPVNSGTVSTASFKIVQTPLGTSPTATSPTDTLTLTSSDNSVSITGNSSTDVIDIKSTPGPGSISLSDGKILVGNGSNVAAAVSMTGDASISDTGVVTVGPNLYGTKIFNGVVELSSGSSAAPSLIFTGTSGSNTGFYVGSGGNAGILIFQSSTGNELFRVIASGMQFSQMLTLANSTAYGHVLIRNDGNAGIDNAGNVYGKGIVFQDGTYNANGVTLKAASGSAAYNLVYPVAQGGAGRHLENDGSGNYSWVQATDANTASTLVKRDGSGNFSAGAITASLTGNATNVTGVVAIANGGTNSSTSLNNNRVVKSSGGALIEAAAITANRALISDSNGIPTQSTTTNTELGYVSGVTSALQTQLNTLDPTLTSYLFDDFTSPEAALHGDTNWKSAATASGTNTLAAVVTANHPGITTISTATTSTLGGYGYWRNDGSYITGGGSIEKSIWVRPPTLGTTADQYSFVAGFQNGSSTNATPTNGWYWSYNPGLTFTVTGTTTNGQTGVTGLTGWTGVIDGTSVQNGMTITGTGIQASTTVSGTVSGTSLTLSQNANASGTNTLTITVGDYWVFTCAKASVYSVQVTSQSVVAATWYRLYSLMNSAGTSVSAGIGVSGGAVSTLATITTNIPVATVGAGFHIKKSAGTGNARTMDIDCWRHLITFTSAR